MVTLTQQQRQQVEQAKNRLDNTNARLLEIIKEADELRKDAFRAAQTIEMIERPEEYKKHAEEWLKVAQNLNLA